MRLVTYWLQSPVDRLGGAGSCAFKVPLLLVLCAGLSRLSRPTLTFRPAAVWGGVEREGNLLLRPASARRNCPAPMTHPRAYITLSPLSGVFGAAIARRSCVGPIVGDWCLPLGACSALTCLLLYGVAGCCCDVFIIHIWILKSIGNRK